MINRRSILTALGLVPLAHRAGAEGRATTPPARPYTPWNAKPFVSHLGYGGAEGKHVLMQDIPGDKTFAVVNVGSLRAGTLVFTGPLVKSGSDLGSWLIGDFSAVTAPGVYRVSVHSNVAMMDEN